MADDERGELRDSVRHLLTRASSSEAVRSAVEEPLGHDPELWRQMVELGYTGIHVPEEHGGAGAGYLELAVLLHELGRQVTPSPFFASAVLATGAVLSSDNADLRADLLPGLVAGERCGSVAITGSRGSVDPAARTMRWEPDGELLRLSGTSAFVPHAHVADVLIVAATAADGTPALVALDASTPGVTIDATPTVDPTRRLFAVTVEDVPASADQLLCEPGPATATVLERLVATGAIALVADAAGVAERVLEETSAYAKERVQFGRPIGSFQAVKHHCADMLIAVECSRAAARAGVEALADPGADVLVAAAVAKSYAAPACAEVSALGIDVHGGIGFTWEHDSHLFLKRAKLDEAWYGSPSWHRRRLARSLRPVAQTEEIH